MIGSNSLRRRPLTGIGFCDSKKPGPPLGGNGGGVSYAFEGFLLGGAPYGFEGLSLINKRIIMNIQENLKKPVVEFGLCEKARLLIGLKLFLGGSQEKTCGGVRARQRVESCPRRFLNPNDRLPG